MLGDPGSLVRYGLPIARVLHDLSAALTIGLLVLAAGILPGQGEVPGVGSYSSGLPCGGPPAPPWCGRPPP